MRIAVLIPCYNESKTIKKVVDDFRKVLPLADVYVYDNNSTDGTDLIARDAGATVRYERRQGKGNVIRTMFRNIDADCYLMVDGDDTYPAESAIEMVNQVLKNGVDMVIGDRLSSTYFLENKRPFHNIGNVMVRNLVNWFFNGEIKDIMTGYRAFSKSFVKSFPIMSKGFEIETEMTIHGLDKNFSMQSLPVEYRDRPEGSQSKLNTITDGARVLRTIFLLFKDYKPFPFFLSIALILFTLSLILSIPVLITYINIGLVPRMPTFVAAVFCALGAIQSITCGLILDTENKTSKKMFEIQMNIIEMISHNNTNP